VTAARHRSLLERLVAGLRHRLRAARFRGSHAYWEARYAEGGNSGVGSYGKFAAFKADVLNRFVLEHAVRDVIEFGCGDGGQLARAKYLRYVGFDVSETAVRLCQEKFSDDATRSFKLLRDYAGERAELTLSLDVIYHLVEDAVFDDYMRRLFNASTRYVAIYASNSATVDGDSSPHVRHRVFTDWVAAQLPDWRLVSRVPNAYPYRGDYREGSFADFYIFEKVSAADA
jgi:SAM-dependent methyltransferase